jgi:aspartyl/asparaginyl beta-hydroxylase (cupin superfamily)
LIIHFIDHFGVLEQAKKTRVHREVFKVLLRLVFGVKPGFLAYRTDSFIHIRASECMA